MKNLIYITVLSLFLASCSDSDENIDPISLPDAATTFIATYFGEVGIREAEKDEKDASEYYSVELNNGTDINFDKDGIWTSIDCELATIPEGILILEPIAKMLVNIITDEKAFIDVLNVSEIDRKLGTKYEIEMQVKTETTTLNIDAYFQLDGTYIKWELDI